MKKAISVALLILFSFSAGCARIIDATTEEPIDMNPGKRSLGAYVDDQQLETIARVNLRKASDSLKEAHVSVVSYNGIMLLTGQVPSAQLRQLAGDTVKKINKVRQVFNEIQVQGKTSMLARTNDTWLSTKVKSALLADKEIAGGRIKVVTEDGVVYLLGLLTRQEADQAANLVSRIGGVQKVVKAIEYIDAH